MIKTGVVKEQTKRLKDKNAEKEKEKTWMNKAQNKYQ